jgi:hypothetical protein
MYCNSGVDGSRAHDACTQAGAAAAHVAAFAAGSMLPASRGDCRLLGLRVLLLRGGYGRSMPAQKNSRSPVRSTIRRAVLVLAVLVTAAAIAAGCGDEKTAAGLDGAGGGPMAWLPADTWLVATANASAATIDDGLQSLDRLAIWSLAEGFLPAQNGVDLRLELLEQLATQTHDGDDPKLTKEDLEAAFGDRAGLAVFDNDIASLSEDDAPIVVWIHVDDEQLALEVTRSLIDGDEREAEHEGVTYYETADEQATFTVRDELLLLTTSPARMEQLIDVHHDDSGTLADDQTAMRVVEAGVGESIAGIAIQTDPLLAAVPQLVAEGAAQAKRVQASDGITVADSGSADALTQTAAKLEGVLTSKSVDSLVPDWLAGSVTVDKVGMRMRGAWSNPRPLAKPEPGSRELVERMPADAPQVSAMVSDGSQLTRVQAAWADARDEADLELGDLFSDCPPANAWACRLAGVTIETVLEDESLAEAIDDADDSVSVTMQSFAPLLEQSIALSGPAKQPATAAMPKLTARVMEVVTSMSTDLDWTPPAALQAAMRQAGISVVPGPKGAIVVKVRPASPAGTALRQALDPEARQAFAALGIDAGALLSPKGLSLAPQQVDDLAVFGFPASAPSAVVPALEGDADVLGDDRDYIDAVDAAKPPKQVGTYGWFNLSDTIESALTALSKQQPEVARALPSVRNNLADVPGMVWWSGRTTVDGETVGVAEAVIPILE